MTKRKHPAALQSGEAQEVGEQNPSLAVPEQRQVPVKDEIWRPHAEGIAEVWERGQEHARATVLETGKRLWAAKKELHKHSPGLWLMFVQSKLPFGEDVAQKCMAVAANAVLSNTAHGRFLPTAMKTLYALTRVAKELGDDELVARIEDGTINPTMEEKQARALLKPTGAKQSKKQSSAAKLAKELEAVKEHAAELEAAREEPEELERLREENHALKRENLALQSEVEELRAALGKQPLAAETTDAAQ